MPTPAMYTKASTVEGIDADRQDLTLMLQRLVQAASPNPPGNTEAAIAVLGDYLATKGISYTIRSPQARKPEPHCQFSRRQG
jgi:hypothetical protein